MKRFWIEATLLVGAPFFASNVPVFAQTWSGFLVDANCYETSELNVNPTDTLTAVDRDKDLEVRLCRPNVKTKSFIVVQHNSQIFKLDSAGNAKAAELVRKAGKESFLEVTLTGQTRSGTLYLDSISLAK